ncbi:monocarboxylate transporter 5-like [Mizuhopecten yessoensis]|uniref:Monocarboxylate transporter 5 n=1 Tax=Mizuhopecten yessoensis TaxID=6573 RepID=A0A210PUD9_MIZYE|nr:monocarboxylate transporter 5-like [Mizuhopecten yessoensis]OWF40072.1 Monocarboxylate transporter 5 [Mizuhopecten yessoensis]
MGDNSPPLDGGWGWMVVLGFFGCNFFMVGIAKSFGIMLEELVIYFNTDMATAALVMGVAGGIYTLASPLGLAFGQVFSQRVVVIFGGIMGCFGVSLCYFVVSIEYVICMFGIFAGLSNACLFGNGLVMLGYYFEKRRSIANALALIGASVGQFGIPPILQHLLDTYTIRGTFLFLGGFYLNLCICGALYRPISLYANRNSADVEAKDSLNQNNITELEVSYVDTTGNHHSETETLAPGNCHKVEVSEIALLKSEMRYGHLSSTGSLVMGSMESLGQIVIAESKQLDKVKQRSSNSTFSCGLTCPKLIYWSEFKKPIVVIYTLVSFFLFFGYFNFIIFLPLDAASKEIDKHSKTWLVSISGIGDLLGRIFIGVLGDLNVCKRYKIMSVMCIICGTNIILYGIADTYWWMALHVAVYGFSGGAYVAINAVVLIDLVGLEVMPRALGLILLIQGFGAAVGQPFEGYIRDITLSFQTLTYLNGFCMIFGAVILFLHPMIVGLFEPKYEQPLDAATIINTSTMDSFNKTENGEKVETLA